VCQPSSCRHTQLHSDCCVTRAGFSGETNAEHAATLDLLRATRFDNAFLFSYSQRDKTHAARHLPDDVPADVKARRLAEAFEAYR
jgi:tRNA-2-methylthio-N6-dimethylallyladenosine synthase